MIFATLGQFCGVSEARPARLRVVAAIAAALVVLLTAHPPARSQDESEGGLHERVLQALQDGDLLAMLKGGDILSDPKFGIVDARRAFKLWQSAAKRGAARGQYEAGRSLMIGQGVRKDDLSGADWLEKSARQWFCARPVRLCAGAARRQGPG